MSFSQRDQKVLSSLRQAKDGHPDLASLLSFYEKLFQVQFALKAQLESRSGMAGLKTREVNPGWVAEGIPQLTFDNLIPGGAPFRQLFVNILELLVSYTGSPRPLAAELESVNVLAYAREIFLTRAPLVAPGRPDLIRTAAGLSMAPYLQGASEILMPRLVQDRWGRGFCPMCGGQPCFAGLNTEAGARILLCPRCNGEWSHRRVGCPFCEGCESQTYHLSEDGRYRLYLCDSCRRYLKTVDLEKTGPDICLPVECLLTVSMDIAAQEKGYQPL